VQGTCLRREFKFERLAAGACIAAENGATEKQLMAIFGWQTMKEAVHYTKMANQKRLAASAMPLLSLDQTANNSLPLLGSVEESGSKRGKSRGKSKPDLRRGAQGRNRTTDTVIFSHVLYQLSYLGAETCRTGRAWRAQGL
jgi:hypothetical protein